MRPEEIEQLRAEMVRDAVANDYESLDQIIEDVARWCAEEGVQCDPAEIPKILCRLLNDGLVDAFSLSPSAAAVPVAKPVWRTDDLAGLFFFRRRPEAEMS